MKVGDLVSVNVPVGKRAFSDQRPQRTLYSTRGIVIEMKKIPLQRYGRPDCEKWWYVLRSDTGAIEKFHEMWCEITRAIGDQ